MSTPDPNLSPEAEVVLGAISSVSDQLDAARSSQEALRNDLQADAKGRFRQTVGLIVAVAVFLFSAGLGYAQYDRVTRCNSRADTIETIKRVIAEDHEALPAGLLKGFGDNEDTQRVVEVIRLAYDNSEVRIDQLLPVPDCSGFLP